MHFLSQREGSLVIEIAFVRDACALLKDCIKSVSVASLLSKATSCAAWHMIIERLMGNLVHLSRLVGGGIYIRAVASN